MSTPTQRVFDAKDLAGSDYESCDATTPTATSPMVMTIPLRPRADRPRAVMHPDWPTPDPDIVDVLNQKVTLRDNSSSSTTTTRSRTMTLLEASRPGCGASPSQQPPYEFVVKLHNALRDSKLSLAQKQKLFACLEWKFECLGCRAVKTPEAFASRGFQLWGPKMNGRFQPKLTSGPCTECVENQRGCDAPDVLVTLKVDLPPECRGGKVQRT